MKKTLLLCFIHGFKGGEDTFGVDYQFTKDLRDLVGEALPKLKVEVVVYPKYETRGDLGSCVSRFRDWLQNKVIDMEVAAGTPSPTIEPSVRTILVGHSMGGIVAAEMLIGLASEKPIYTEDGIQKSEKPTFNSLMFPYIQGVLAFDTPYLGISPGVVAHGAEDQYQNAAQAVGAISQLSGLGASLWGAKTAGSPSTSPAPPKTAGALPAPSASGGNSWQKWGKMAMYAGAAGAVAAGGAAAWMKRDQLGEGWSWASSHLEFVGCLARGEELRKRVACLLQLREELDVGFANLYTRLGKAAPSKQINVVGTVLGQDRTFCNLPKKQPGGVWMEAINNKATDEAGAHMNMFTPRENPGYNKLAQDATEVIHGWLQNGWYETSAEEPLLLEEAPLTEDVLSPETPEVEKTV
ncbi:uncharacterized protein BKA55DRAFT_500364 [Fusarium redolens]|uniref:DUF676 domain-containing protein n=1 Tax=Fusarium redolens TaxID=48865 RepID=A0A9P9R5S6_FUSRE|nr:uncharacterized protein BKA55DRAFT_500364 [Fusarium redolens]KAH7267382.1 hypothetical protein BKA55DRAFT_500364 [Fusarium redolens]